MDITLYDLYKDLGVGVASIIVIIGFARWISIKAFDQIEKANNALQESSKNNMRFMEEVLNKNTETLINLTTSLDRHTKSKDEALETIKQKDKTINELFEMLKDTIRNRRTING